MIATAHQLVDDTLRAAFRPRERLTVSQWADRHRVVTLGATPGPWSTDRAPYLREIQDAFNDPACREITVMKASQVGGTEAIYNIVMFSACEQPGANWLWALSTEDATSTWTLDRFLPACRATPAVAAALGQTRRDQTGMRVGFRSGGTVWYTGGQSETKQESVPVKNTIVDELDRCESGTPDRMRQRSQTFIDGKSIQCGTPGVAGHGIDLEYHNKDQRRLWMQCPLKGCGRWSPQEGSHLRWPGRDGKYGRDPMADKDRAEREAKIRCRHCRGLIGVEHHRRRLATAVWVPEGCWVEAGKLCTPEGYVEAARRSWSIRGVDSALVPGNHFGRIARRWLELKQNPAATAKDWQQYFNHYEGVGYYERGENLELRELKDLRGAYGDAGATYTLGQVPPWGEVLTAGVDLQADRAVIVIDAWGPYGHDCGLVWCGEIPIHANEPLDKLETWLKGRRFVRLGDRRELAVAFGAIDTGFRRVDVLRFIGSSNIRHWLKRGLTLADATVRAARGPLVAVKGFGEESNALHYWTRPEKFPDGTAPPGNIELLMINSGDWFDVAAGRLRARLGAGVGGVGEDMSGAEEGETGVGGGGRESGVGLESGAVVTAGVRRYWLPGDAPDWFLYHLTTEHKVPRIVNGRARMAWQLKQKGLPNHAADCRKYNEALADVKQVRAMRGRAASSPAAPAVAVVVAPKAAGAVPGARRGTPGIAGPGYLKSAL